VFGHIAGFEIRYQLRSALFWVTFLIFFLLTFGSVASDNIRIGAGGNVDANSPYAIAQTLMVMTVFGIFIMTAFVSNVVLRDDETGFSPIVHSTRISKFDYLFGRFTGAFVVGCLVFLSTPLGMLVGAAMPWLDPETLGPLRLQDYGYAYFLLCMPTLFVTAAGFFALATATRSMLATYVGVIVFLVLYLVASSYFARPEFQTATALVDPFGIGAFEQATRYWTATERNTRMPGFTGFILWNRLIWFGLSFLLLALAWRLFRVGSPPVAKEARRRPRWWRKARAEEAKSQAARPVAPRRPVTPDTSSWAQVVALTRFDVAAVLRHPAFLVLLGIGFLNAAGGLWFADEFYGVTIHPVTRVMIETLEGAFTIIPLIVAIYYAGELVWRDRERRFHEIVDATPAPDWVFMLPKVLAIALVLLATVAASVLAAITVQSLKGYTNFELHKYLQWYLLPWTIDVVLFAALAVFIQTLVPQKFVGWLVMLLVIVAQVTLGRLGFEHNLYQFAGAPPVPLSDMNGQGRFALYAAWFRAYWAAFAVLLLVLAYALWRRGAVSPLSTRLRRMPARITGTPYLVSAVALLAMAVLGGYIFYNTNVVNEYRTRIDDEQWLANYEKALLPLEKAPQPRVAHVTLRVDIYPNRPRVVTEGTYLVENRTAAPLRELHVRWPRELKMERLDIGGARLEQEFPEFNYRIYQLTEPLAAGARREIHFATVREQRGFRNSGNDTQVVGNGTFLNSFDVAPQLGMGRDFLLQDRAKRRKYGLPPELRPPKLEDESARAFNFLRRDSDWVTADLTVSTEADQVAIAPGYKATETVEGNRRIALFRTDAPIMHFFSIQSARYAVRESRWNDVDLAVFYDPAHAYNVDRMLEAMKASLDYFTVNFSPFQFRQLRVLEFPDYADFAQSFANTIPYSEGIGFIANFRDPEKIDMVTYVTAHEVAHQWWGHQVIGAEMQGMTFVSETLAQYSALKVMERMYGPDQIRKFLKYELDRYLRSRGSEVIEELPLERVEGQNYIHYQKGSLAMYLLKDIVGEEAVNRALQGFLAEFAFKGPPYPTSLDLLRYVRAEAGPQHDALVTDLFQKIALYDARVESASAKRRADGRWDVTLEIEARKLYADGEGRETEATLEEPFDIGVFTAEPGKKDFTRANVLSLRRELVRSGRQKLTVVVDREPKFAGVDPYNKRIDRNSDDNLKRVDVEA
jgi:aminopeptidase N